MATAHASLIVSGSVREVQDRWYDPNRWPHWVDGLSEVLSVDPEWPRPAASVSWQSGPAGRGRVVERVVGYEPLAGQTLEVQDDSIEGLQRVAFTPGEGNVVVSLSLEYRIKRRSPITPLVDALFIKRAMARSLQTTLARFAVELAAARRADVG